MARYVVTAASVVVPFVSYAQPERRHKRGDVVELSASEVTAIGAGNLRALSSVAGVAAAGNRDTLGRRARRELRREQRIPVGGHRELPRPAGPA